MNKIFGFGAMLLVSLALSGCSSSEATSGIQPTSSDDASSVSTQQSTGSKVKTTPIPSIYSGDKDCADFSTHSQAQAYFEAKGGSSSNNVDKLDRDGDGIACETLP